MLVEDLKKYKFEMFILLTYFHCINSVELTNKTFKVLYSITYLIMNKIKYFNESIVRVNQNLRYLHTFKYFCMFKYMYKVWAC